MKWMKLTSVSRAILVLVLASFWAHAQKQEPRLAGGFSRMGFVAVSKDQTHFVQRPWNKKFVPWGVNYDRDYKSRLLEDYWLTEWSTVEQDLAEIKALGGNVVRIHLQLGKFMRSPSESDPVALRQLGRLLVLAEKQGLYLDLTGLACYRKSDTPAWYDPLPEQERWKVQAHFWEAIAKQCAKSPAVFCYDLMNEPIVPESPRPPRDWLTGFLAGFHYCQFVSLDRGTRTKTEVARQWIRTLTAAIRRQDKVHMITVGFLPGTGSGFSAKELVSELDYISVHVYPESGKPDTGVGVLETFSAGKPLVIEEMFPLKCNATEFREFLKASRSHASGWFGFYWGKTEAECNRSSFEDAFFLAWLQIFKEGPPTP